MRERVSKHNRLPVCKPAAPPVCSVTFPPQRQIPPATPPSQRKPDSASPPASNNAKPLRPGSAPAHSPAAGRSRRSRCAAPGDKYSPIPPGCNEWNGRTPHPKSAAACPVSHPIPQLLQKPNDTGAPVSLLLYRPIQFPGHTDGADGTDGAQMLPAQPAPDDRSLSHRRPGAPRRQNALLRRFPNMPDAKLPPGQL